MSAGGRPHGRERPIAVLDAPLDEALANADRVVDRVDERGPTRREAVGVSNDTEAAERIEPGPSVAGGVTRIVDRNPHLGQVREVVDRTAGGREVEVQQRVRDACAMDDVLGTDIVVTDELPAPLGIRELR